MWSNANVLSAFCQPDSGRTADAPTVPLRNRYARASSATTTPGELVQSDFEARGYAARIDTTAIVTWQTTRGGTRASHSTGRLQRQVTTRLPCVTSRLAHFDTVTGTNCGVSGELSQSRRLGFGGNWHPGNPRIELSWQALESTTKPHLSYEAGIGASM